MEKTALYFDAGAKEVWLCLDSGTMIFHRASDPTLQLAASELFPDFPANITLV